MGNHGQWAPRLLGVDMVHTRMVNVGKEQRGGAVLSCCPIFYILEYSLGYSG